MRDKNLKLITELMNPERIKRVLKQKENIRQKSGEWIGCYIIHSKSQIKII